MDTDLAIETWKVKRLIKMLENARGNGTSMISLILPPKDSVARANRMLVEEYGMPSPLHLLLIMSKSPAQLLILYEQGQPAISRVVSIDRAFSPLLPQLNRN